MRANQSTESVTIVEHDAGSLEKSGKETEFIEERVDGVYGRQEAGATK